MSAALTTLAETWIRNGGSGCSDDAIRDRLRQMEKESGSKLTAAERTRLLKLAAALREPEPSLDESGIEELLHEPEPSLDESGLEPEVPAPSDVDFGPAIEEPGADPDLNGRARTQGAAAEEPGPYRLVPIDWEPIIARGIPEIEYVSEPYLPARKRIWGVGAAEAGKSIWAASKASELTRAGLIVVYISQENGLEEEIRRFVRLRPDFSNLRLYVDQGLDLALADHVAALIEVSGGAALDVIDTLSACWSGDEDSNAAITALDRDVLLPLIRETGTSPLVLDHTGNPQPFVRRRGVSAPRGASAKGQKADFLLEFRATGDRELQIAHAKARGARKEPLCTFQVVDGEDGALDVVEIETPADAKTLALADDLVEAISEAGALTTKALREAAKKLQAGVRLQNAAIELLEAEDPPRVAVAREKIETESGPRDARVWRPTGSGDDQLALGDEL